jgi:hypothetical protein
LTTLAAAFLTTAFLALAADFLGAAAFLAAMALTFLMMSAAFLVSLAMDLLAASVIFFWALS